MVKILSALRIKAILSAASPKVLPELAPARPFTPIPSLPSLSPLHLYGLCKCCSFSAEHSSSPRCLGNSKSLLTSPILCHFLREGLLDCVSLLYPVITPYTSPLKNTHFILCVIALCLSHRNASPVRGGTSLSPAPTSVPVPWLVLSEGN